MHTAAVSLDEIRSLKAFLLNSRDLHRLQHFKHKIDHLQSRKPSSPSSKMPTCSELNKPIERIGVSPTRLSPCRSTQDYFIPLIIGHSNLSPQAKNGHFLKNDYLANQNHMNKLRMKYNLPSNKLTTDKDSLKELQSDSHLRPSLTSKSKTALDTTSTRPEHCFNNDSITKKSTIEKIHPSASGRKLHRQKTSPQVGEDHCSPPSTSSHRKIGHQPQRRTEEEGLRHQLSTSRSEKI